MHENHPIYFYLVGFFLSNIALTAECGNPVSIEAVSKLSATVTLGDLTGKFGEACQGEGPVSWYQRAKDKQIWFYWKKSAQPAMAGCKNNQYGFQEIHRGNVGLKS